MAEASCRYKQVRVTLTEEIDRQNPGRVRVSVRVLVKPLKAAWNERHCVLSTSAAGLPPLATLDEVYGALMEILAHPPLPESHTAD